jgi:hypothetical protein
MRLGIAAMALTGMASLAGTTASADNARPPAEGARVRVTASGVAGEGVVGDLVGIEADRIVVQRIATSELVTIPRDDVIRLEVATTRKRKGHGAGIGALIGLGIGAAVGFAVGDDCSAPDAPGLVCMPREGAAAGLGLAGAGVGALLGLALSPHETVWQPVDAAGLHVSVTPSASPAGGLGLRLSLSF